MRNSVIKELFEFRLILKTYEKYEKSTHFRKKMCFNVKSYCQYHFHKWFQRLLLGITNGIISKKITQTKICIFDRTKVQKYYISFYYTLYILTYICTYKGATCY